MVSSIINELGFKQNIKGTKLIIELLESHFSNKSMLPLCKKGYIIMSQNHNKTVSTIIKDIQYAIDNVFLNGNNKILFDVFGSTIDENTGRPTSKQFLLTLIDRIQNELNKK